MTEDIRCVLLPLSGDVRGFTVCKDDYYTIVLREDLDPEIRIQTYQHEIDHIRNGDCDSDESADLIERRSHG